MELRQLEYLMSISEEHSFSRAAEKRFVTQSALSQMIQKLETEVGGPLIDRGTRQIRLTPAGEVLVNRAAHIFAELEMAHAEIREVHGLQRGSLRVGTVQTVNATLMPGVVTVFANDYPKIAVQIEELSAGEIEAGLMSGALQVGVGFIPTTKPGIDTELLFTEELVLIVPPDHHLAEYLALDLAALDDLPVAMLPTRFCTRRLWDEYAQAANISLDVRIEMNAITSLLNIVENTGIGTILPQLALPHLTHAEDSRNRLRSIRLINPTPTRAVGLLWLTNGFRCDASRAFAKVFRAQLAAFAPGLVG